MKRATTIATAIALTSCSALISAAWSPPNPNPAAAPAGAYAIEPAHTQVMFSVLHFGLTNYSGVFPDTSGTLRFDPADPARMAVDVRVKVATLRTTSTVLDGKLRGEDWLDAARFPEMRFVSTRVTRTGPNTADIAGELTLHGQTHPLLLRATYYGAAVSPFSHRMQLGFALAGTLRRSDWGVTNFVPVISDAVTLTIAAAFEKS